MELQQTEAAWLSTRSPHELIGMIRAQKEWPDNAARNLDSAMTAMIGAVLAHSAPDLDELEDYQSLLRSAVQHLPEATNKRERYLARWAGLSDCLRIRAELMVHGSYEAVSHMHHVDEILQAIGAAAGEGLPQGELQKKLGLQPANLTRILNTLENHRVIVRERKGKEKRVRLGPNAPERAAVTETGSSGASIFWPRTGTHG